MGFSYKHEAPSKEIFATFIPSYEISLQSLASSYKLSPTLFVEVK
jgi:hypothetical protein